MGFNISEAQGSGVYTGRKKQLEEGDYPVMISKAVEAAGKKDGTTNAVMEYTIIDGDFSGEVVKEWLSIVNNSEIAQQIARSKVNAISSVTGVTDGGIDAFQGAEMIIRVHKEPNEYINRNGDKVKGFNAVVANYMTLQMKDAEGKDVAPFVPSANKTDSQPDSNSSGQSNSDNTSSRSIDTTGVDDDIPF